MRDFEGARRRIEAEQIGKIDAKKKQRETVEGSNGSHAEASESSDDGADAVSIGNEADKGNPPEMAAEPDPHDDDPSPKRIGHDREVQERVGFNTIKTGQSEEDFTPVKRIREHRSGGKHGAKPDQFGTTAA